jgi:hypothetical protein
MGYSPPLRDRRTKLGWPVNLCIKQEGSSLGAMRFPRMFQEMVMALKAEAKTTGQPQTKQHHEKIQKCKLVERG